MGSKLRIGMIGTGMMGLEHIMNLRLFDEVEIVALADPHPVSRQWGLSALGAADGEVAVYEDTAAMLAGTGPDAVVISSPNHIHVRSLEPVLGAGVHVLCEKPLCSDLADARHVAEAARSHPGVFWVGMEYRFMPPAAAFIDQVHAGRVGRLQMLSIREHRFPFLIKVGDWNRFSVNTGGTMVEKCCHFFDLMRLITQAEPVRIYCSGAMDVNHLDERYGGRTPDIIDNSFTVVEFEGGIRAMLDLCMFADGAEHQEEISATGDTGRLDVLIPPGELVFSPRTGFANPKRVSRSRVEVDPTAMAAGSHFGATYHQHRAFLDAVLHGGPVQVSARDGLLAVAMGTAAEISAREKRVVTMGELGF
jgi:myo-inositol 2-dehydrogenase / D-chiro-inositol 1-dehydrogenase